MSNATEKPPDPESRRAAGQGDPNSAKTRKKTIRPRQIVKLAKLRERYWKGDLSAKDEILRILRKAVA